MNSVMLGTDACTPQSARSSRRLLVSVFIWTATMVLAFATGCGLVGSFTYSLLVTAGIIAEADVSDLILLMTLTYMAAAVTGKVRYR